MNKKSSNKLETFTPLKQVLVIGILMLLAIFVEYSIIDETSKNYNPNAPWEMMGTFVLFFILVNSVISLTIRNAKNYWLQSILSFIILCGIGYLVCYLMTGIHIHKAGHMITILGLFCFAFLLLLSIVRAMRTILEYVKKQDDEMRNKQSKM